MWGTYAEYKINNEFILVFKDGLREGDEPIENLRYCQELFEKQPNSICEIVNKGDGLTDQPLKIDDSSSEDEEEKRDVEKDSFSSDSSLDYDMVLS